MFNKGSTGRAVSNCIAVGFTYGLVVEFRVQKHIAWFVGKGVLLLAGNFYCIVLAQHLCSSVAKAVFNCMVLGFDQPLPMGLFGLPLFRL